MFDQKFSQAPYFSLRPQVLLLISTLLYFFPYVIGSFEYMSPYGGRYIYYYHKDTIYPVLAAICIIAATIALIKDRCVDFSIRDNYGFESVTLSLFIIAFGAYLFIFSPELFSYRKSEVLEATNRVTYIFYYSCGLAVVFSFMSGWRKHKLLLAIGIFGLLTTLYIGHRSYLAVTIGGIAYLFFRNRSILKTNPMYFAGTFFVIMFLAVYKSIYVAIKMGDFSAVRNRLLENPLTDNAIIGLEQFVIFAHLDFIVTYDYSLPCTNLWKLPAMLIPFMDELIDISTCGYNAQVQQTFFSGYSGGVAANIWAEFYAIFGYAGIPMVVAAILLFAGITERFISKTRSPLIKAGLVMAIIELTIYIQRKELMGAITSAKRVIIIALLVYACAYVARNLSGRDTLAA